MSIEMEYDKAARLMEQFGCYPRFTLLPGSWYTGTTVQKADHRLEVSMSAAFPDHHLKFFYSYVLAAF